MKKITVFLTIIAVILMTVPVSASGRVIIGERLNINPIEHPEVEQSFAENTPFHIKHGWRSLVENRIPLGYLSEASFSLQLNGVDLEEDFVYRFSDLENGVALAKSYVFNFPEGMIGTHYFTGHWFLQCKYMQDECENPNGLLEYLTHTVTVHFVP